jgi:hypothetical protein
MSPVTESLTESAAAAVDDDSAGQGDRWQSLGPRQRSALISWVGFTVTFAAVRGLTHAIKNGVSSTGDLTIFGVHVHHYLWGIKLLAASGGIAVHGNDRIRSHPLVAAAYGAGSALVIDEFSLLVHFKDVYWTERGRSSVLLATGLIGGTGASFAFIPMWQRRHPHPRSDGHDSKPHSEHFFTRS